MTMIWLIKKNILIIKKRYFKEKLIPVNLNQQQTLDTDQNAIKQINFTKNLEQLGNTTFFILEK